MALPGSCLVHVLEDIIDGACYECHEAPKVEGEPHLLQLLLAEIKLVLEALGVDGEAVGESCATLRQERRPLSKGLAHCKRAEFQRHAPELELTQRRSAIC
jgi:hypothetical protein